MMGSLVALKTGSAVRNIKVAAYKVRKIASNTDAKVIELSLDSNRSESPLSAEQREELVITYRLKARKLARSILRKWHARLDLQEVDSVVDLSLCEAVKRFNPKMGASFMTFLFYHLRGNLIRTVTTAAASNLIPLGELETYFAQRDEGDTAGDKQQTAVNAIEIAEALCGNDYPLPEEVVLKKELIDLSHKACSKLDDLAKEVISRIYLQGQQLIDIANSLGYSRCHISRVKKKALETLYQDLSEVMGLPADAKRPDFDEEEEHLGGASRGSRRKIFRRRPRSKKAQYAVEEKIAVGAH